MTYLDQIEAPTLPEQQPLPELTDNFDNGMRALGFSKISSPQDSHQRVFQITDERETFKVEITYFQDRFMVIASSEGSPLLIQYCLSPEEILCKVQVGAIRYGIQRLLIETR